MASRGVEGKNWSLIAGVAIAALIIGYLIGARGQEAARPATPAQSVPPVAAVTPAPVAEQSVAELQPLPAAPSPPRAVLPVTPPAAVASAIELPPVPRGDGRRIALVIDDLGRRVQDVVDLSELGVPLSFGVLPFETRTSDVIAELDRRGAEVLLHLPMQPSTEADPGPGALTRGMSRAELEAATRWALGAVNGAIGVNNHMGSELSADVASMRPILAVLAERDLFFLDSRTSPDSVGYQLALEMGLAAAERQVFLDAEAEPDAIRGQFRRLLGVARDRGSAVAIAHPHADTIAVLREEIPQALAAGFEFVEVSSLTSRAGGPELLR